MDQLSAIADKKDYADFRGQIVKLNGEPVRVLTYVTYSTSGSYERGFKFTNSTYGYLERRVGTSTAYSPDHGKTWYIWIEDMRKQRAGKILVSREKHGEFAFENIQRINKSYNPDYKWRA
jgi:hypothetical protein